MPSAISVMLSLPVVMGTTSQITNHVKQKHTSSEECKRLLEQEKKIAAERKKNEEDGKTKPAEYSRLVVV